jgi:acyl-CoA reductase-like NAD-dependent aldehyde dehydrogenase
LRSLGLDAAQLKRIRLPNFDKVRGQVTEAGRSCEDARRMMFREAWLDTVVRELQIAAGRLSVADPESLESILPTVVDTIPQRLSADHQDDRATRAVVWQ